jgi:hypothetical protein
LTSENLPSFEKVCSTGIVVVLTFRCAKQFYVPNMQEQSKAGKKSEINRQTFVI